ncbi:hypothetical protein ACS0TY_005769 [Phlomoides rotata]
MNHLENFEGTVYENPDLGKALVRRVLRGKYCAQILMSNYNHLRHTLMKRVSEFNKKKPYLIEEIAEKKKAEREKMKKRKR